MSKSPSSAYKTSPLEDESLLFVIVEWLNAYKRMILWGFLALFILIVAAYRWISVQTLNAESDFFTAQSDFSQFKKKTFEKQNGSEELNQLEKVLSSRKELHAKYDGLIAQTLLIGGESEKAIPFAQSNFQRIEQDQVDVYLDYARTTLLIEKGQMQEALNNALLLKEKLSQSQELNLDTLQLFNLLRIAILYQQLNEPSQELISWKALQDYPGKGKENFLKEFSIEQYLAARLSQLY